MAQIQYKNKYNEWVNVEEGDLLNYLERNGLYYQRAYDFIKKIKRNQSCKASIVLNGTKKYYRYRY